jgi:aminoglycoside phosphotransferase (APT) family kinase protein
MVAFSVADVGEALGRRVFGVDVVERFAASAAEVARLRVLPADRDELQVIGKYATGAGVAGARREVWFFEQLAPRWNHPAPQLLGVCDDGDGVLLLSEDLDAAGYRSPGASVSAAQLRGTIETLVDLHACFWNDAPSDAAQPELSVTSTAQAWPPEVITRHAAAVRDEAERFTELEAADRVFLEEILGAWEQQFHVRVAGGASITLIHGDFHFLGNIFFRPADVRPKVIDWSEAKPGLGPHDLAYCLTVVPADDRLARDRVLLRQYWDGLRRAGVRDYSWELCEWDYRFSAISNLFQSVFQRSTKWYRKSLAEIDALGSREVLAEPPPVI